MEAHLQTAMKAVGQAVKLDSEGINREAYFRYLSCIQFISQGVLEDAKYQGYQGPIKTRCTVRMLKLAQQCLDRASAIVENTEEGETGHLGPPPSDQSGRFSPSIRSVQSPPPTNPPDPAKPTAGAYRQPTSSMSAPHHPNQSPAAGRGAAAGTTLLPVPTGYMRPPAARKDKLTPLEAAYLENQRLMNSYKARLMKLMGTSRGKGKHNTATLNLTLQRRLMENMAIARAREAALAKKIQERHRRLQEEAARRFSTTGEPTRSEIELRQIYASVMEFENNEDWLLDWRCKLQETPKDLQLINALIEHILACPDHPFTQLLKKFQYSIYQTLLPLIRKDAEELQQIKVPYKMVEALVLSGSGLRVIPPNGFTTPEDLEDEDSLDKDLIRRLQALRKSSHEERRESLYGGLLAPSKSLDEDEEENMWDSGDDSLEDGIVLEDEEKQSPRDSDNDALKERASVEVQIGDETVDVPKDQHSDKERNSEEDEVDSGSRTSEVSVGESGDHQVSKSEDEVLKQEPVKCDREPDEDVKEDIREDDGNGFQQMRRISREVQDDLQDALAAGEELTDRLNRQIEDDLADGGVKQKEGADDLNSVRNNKREGIPDETTDDPGDHDGCEMPSGHDESTTENENPDHETSADSEQEGESPFSGRVAPRNSVSRGMTLPVGETESQGGEGEKLEAEEHPVKTKEEEEQEHIAHLQEEALERHLKHISKDIQSYLDRLQSLLMAIYEDLDSAVAKEQCIAVIEKHFFQFIWQPLLTLYRRANLRKEISAATAMTKYQNALPENIGIVKKLCLSLDSEGAVQDDSHYPYHLAVEELRRITGYFSPLEKLECVVKASRAIITCVGDYYEAQGECRESTENAVGCDDLLPILSFVVIKAALPHLVSECSIMEEFIHEGYLFGEEGYCLTTLQTSLGYVLKLADD